MTMRYSMYFATVLATAMALAVQTSAAPSSNVSTSAAATATNSLNATASTSANHTSAAAAITKISVNLNYLKPKTLTLNPKKTLTSRLMPIPTLPATSQKTPTSSQISTSTQFSTSASTTSSSAAPTGTASSSTGADLDGFFLGANSYYLYALPEADRLAVLNALQSAGMSVIRVFITHIYPNNKGSGNPEIPDLEPTQLGQYDDTILEKIDALMYECSQRNIKLIIACGDRYALGFWDTDQYALTYGIVDGGSGAQMVSDASTFYTDNGAMTFYDHRLDRECLAVP